MSILIYLTDEITEEYIIACNRNSDTRMINVYTLFNMNDYNEENINEQKNISPDKLVFLKVISNVIKSGMNIVGVDTPEKM